MSVKRDQARRGGNLETHMHSKETIAEIGALRRLMRFDRRRQPSIGKRAGTAPQNAKGRFELNGLGSACAATPKIDRYSKSDQKGK